MKAQVDASKCQAYGICNEIAPRIFELDEWGYASVLGYGVVPAEEEELTKQAERSCPALAVVVEEN
jgi:ferredoxin